MYVCVLVYACLHMCDMNKEGVIESTASCL